MKKQLLSAFAAALLLSQACQRIPELEVEPLTPTDLPVIVVLSDEADGDLEDNDEIGIALEILAQWDPTTRDPEGKVPAMPANVQVAFQLSKPEGFTQWGQYVTGVRAIYEIDDCTNNEDAGIILPTTFDPATGKGSFTWPQGQKEMELVLELDAARFDDAALNTDMRGFELQITGITGATGVVANTSQTFAYHVLDDEALFGTWAVDPLDATQWQVLLDHFGPLNEDLDGVVLADIDAVEIEFEQAVMKVKFILKATQPDPCDPAEVENEEIEVEADFASDFADLFNTRSGELEMEGKTEKDGIEIEFELKAEFTLSADGSSLTLQLSGEIDGDELPEVTLNLVK